MSSAIPETIDSGNWCPPDPSEASAQPESVLIPLDAKTTFAEIEEPIHLFHRCVLPVVTVEDNQMVPFGTGFCVCSSDHFAVIVTARHNFETVLSKIRLGTAGEPVLNEQGYEIVDDSLPHALFVGEHEAADGVKQAGGIALPARQIAVSRHADLAALLVSVPTIGGALLRVPVMPLSPGVPDVGAEVIGLGYNAISTEIGDTADDHITVHLDRRLHATRGTVQEVYPIRRDRIVLPFPSFQVDARFDRGMSGGPVSSVRSGGVCGVVTSAYPSEREGTRPTGFCALLAPLFELEFTFSSGDGFPGGKRTLWDLAVMGKLLFDDSVTSLERLPGGDGGTVRYR